MTGSEPDPPDSTSEFRSPGPESNLTGSAGLVPGDHIGPYRLLERIGSGGMGVVFLAEQEHPVRRRVAVKVIKVGMDTAEVIARFESERQALALMNHPNIATVLDAGTTEAGRPYFVMEHVPGLPITDYCDRHQLTTRERAELFVQVCQAVHHAHQKGIIHRDLKPSNVLVAVQDGKPVPKIIDFGVAKATQQRLTEKTLFTQQGVLIGTPEYMSPEQAEMTELGIDSTTDIYSLGVMLYELLVGALPIDPRELRRGGFAAIRYIIRDVDPPKPSTRFSTLGERSAEVARQRHTEPQALARQVRGELDWITMRALEKDRTRRYQSASEFAADIGRQLRDEPVLAGPPSPGYRLTKFMRRHRRPLAATVAGVLLVSIPIVITSSRSARMARHEAVLSRLESASEPLPSRLSRQEEALRGDLLAGRLSPSIGTPRALLVETKHVRFDVHCRALGTGSGCQPFPERPRALAPCVIPTDPIDA